MKCGGSPNTHLARSSQSGNEMWARKCAGLSTADARVATEHVQTDF